LLPAEAVVLSGSQSAGSNDPKSDIDLYVYSHFEVSASSRAAIPKARSDVHQLDSRFWEPGDEWIERETGLKVDVMFRLVSWMEEQLDRVLIQHEASVGYSTCFWFNALHSKILFDRNGWFAELQQQANQPYPEELRQAIIAKNFPILEDHLSSYIHQIELAEDRDDPVSVHHRITAFIASYFDVLFAINRLPHPGEKRLLQYARQHCEILPSEMEEQVRTLLASGSPLVAKELVTALKKIL
jgi:predicted nucleotidyltransferase